MPLFDQSRGFEQYERRLAPLGDQIGAHDRLSKRSGRAQHAVVMPQERLCSRPLFFAELAIKGDVQLSILGPLIVNTVWDSSLIAFVQKPD